MQLPEMEECDERASESQNLPARDLINEALGLLNSSEGSALLLKQPNSTNPAVEELLRHSVPRELHLCISGMPGERPSTEMNLCVSPLKNHQSPTELNLCAARFKTTPEFNFCVAPEPERQPTPATELSASSDSDVRRKSYYQRQYDERLTSESNRENSTSLGQQDPAGIPPDLAGSSPASSSRLTKNSLR